MCFHDVFIKGNFSTSQIRRLVFLIFIKIIKNLSRSHFNYMFSRLCVLTLSYCIYFVKIYNFIIELLKFFFILTFLIIILILLFYLRIINFLLRLCIGLFLILFLFLSYKFIRKFFKLIYIIFSSFIGRRSYFTF